MQQSEINSLGDELMAALEQRRTVPPLTQRHPTLGIDDAYRVANRFVGRMLERGDRIVGKKIGATSRAVQTMLNVQQPDFGMLTDRMAYNSGDAIPISQTMIQPRAEGEIAFLLDSELRGPGISNADVLRATRGVLACFEIIDSRIENWKIRIEDTVADNASCGAFALGDRLVDVADLDLTTCGAVLEHNGSIVATGAGAAALGSPVACVAWLANSLGEHGIVLNAGEIILSGSIVPLIPVAPGDHMRFTVGGIGTVSVRFA